jgi:hypothetical protein
MWPYVLCKNNALTVKLEAVCYKLRLEAVYIILHDYNLRLFDRKSILYRSLFRLSALCSGEIVTCSRKPWKSLSLHVRDLEEPGKQNVIKATEGTVGNKALCLQKGKCTFFKTWSFSTPSRVFPFSTPLELNSWNGRQLIRCFMFNCFHVLSFAFQISFQDQRWVRKLSHTWNIVFREQIPHKLSFVDGWIITDNLPLYDAEHHGDSSVVVDRNMS